ncbi:MAG TPA: class I SAM-dependent methyltransferase [Ktedonobacterales bacterium]|jgi:ubiquinone/menaquinone biosynthesis C-methylase UbiE|nr:class I SAM-dependent methyltransferase [Ktedonobacterales bacterium]
MSWLTFWRRKPTATASSFASAETLAVGERTFVAGVPYILPKDLDETNRLEFQHYMLRSFMRGNYLAPVSAPRDILDVGCGTGRWAMEMAAEFSSANVIGVDVAPPVVSERLPATPTTDNYTFVQGNVLERLPFADNSFDFVHQRYLILAIPAQRWPQVIAELMRVTRPHGWVELIETAPPSGAPALDQLADWGKQMMARRGIDFTMAPQLGPLLQAAGAREVAARPLTIPVGKPGGRLGAMMVADYMSALGAVRGPLAALGVASVAAFDDAMTRARQELDQRSFPQNIYVAYGRKA